MEIAIFPIPDMVALPGQTHKLHVFEPRYRKMVQDCLDEDIMLGLAFPVKRLSEPLQTEEEPDDLGKNMDTYKAANVMGVGIPKVVKTFEDGRIMIKVEILYRVHVQSITQYLPYHKAEADIIPDVCGDPDKAEQLVDEIIDLSGLILGKEISIGGPVAGVIQHRIKAIVLWVCSWFELAAENRQAVLELVSSVQQAEYLLDRMRAFVRINGLGEPELERPRKVRRDGNVIEVDFQNPL